MHNTIFDIKILDEIDKLEELTCYKTGISVLNYGSAICLRPLEIGDFDKGYLELLKKLTVVGEVSRVDFEKKFKLMQSCPNTYFIVVIEDLNSGQIVASGSMVVEEKFIHSASRRGRIEDIVVDEEKRGKEYGKLILDFLLRIAKLVDCYKLSLECTDALMRFYGHFGFKNDGNNYLMLKFHE